MRMPAIPKPAPKPAAVPDPEPAASPADTAPRRAEKAPAAAKPSRKRASARSEEPKEPGSGASETALPKKRRGERKGARVAQVDAAPLPKPGPAPARPKVKMTVYLSRKTRQTADAAVKARVQQFKMEYRSLSAVVVAALEWFLDGVDEASPVFPVERLERRLAGESPYNAPIGLWMEEGLRRKYDLIPSGMRAELCDVIVATWMARVLPGA